MRPRRVAFVPQAPRIFGATIGAELEVYGLPHSQLGTALRGARLPEDPTMSTSALSPGQLRRLAFVRVLHLVDGDGETLVLDEPTAHLDDDNAQIIIDMIAEAAVRVRVILASHDDRVVALADDEIIPRKPSPGTPAATSARPRAQETESDADQAQIRDPIRAVMSQRPRMPTQPHSTTRWYAPPQRGSPSLRCPPML
ncbi:AAA family ATPase [Brevibacterium sp. UCMA 11754]|nr:hypothetical protein [Brevibacterium sp. UCMA 11754]MCF2574584.1 hypothetical protein [Brevibacterium sp. UCMA 11754]